jgi:hypothetical protein
MRTSFLGFVLALLVSRAAPAAVVTYGLDLSVRGEFQIFASADSDNFGLLAYGVPFTAETTAMITSFEHLSPAAFAASDPSSQIGTAGFTLLRTTYTTHSGAMHFMASQDAISPTPHLIRGFGQTASSFADQGLTALGPATQAAWGDALLIARGTYAGDVSNFHIDTSSFDLFANVFVGQAGIHNVQADIQVTGANGFNYTPLPPPTATQPLEPPPAVTPPPIDPPPAVTPPPVITPPNHGPTVIPDPVPPPVVPPRYSDGSSPVVTYNVDLSVPGEFKIFASTSAGDNHGLAFYAVPFTAQTTGMITAIEQMSPAAHMASDENSVVGAAGFTVLRTDYALASGALGICASQDIIGGTPHLIRGFGQTAGSFSELGLTSPDSSNPTAWDDSLLIAQGTYVGDPSDFQLDVNSVDLVANVFSGETGLDNVVADVHVYDTNGFSFVTPMLPPVTVDPSPPAAIDPPTITPPPSAEPGDEPAPPVPTEPPAANSAEENVDEPVDDELIAEPTTWPIRTILPYRGWIDVIDPSGEPFDWWNEGDITVLPWLEAVDSGHAGGLPEPMVADDRFLRPILEEGATRTATDAVAEYFVAALNGTGATTGDSGVPEPSTALLAALSFAALLAPRRRWQARG